MSNGRMNALCRLLLVCGAGWVCLAHAAPQTSPRPNVRAMRSDDWKYIHYPHGDGAPDRHLAELYDLKHDADERANLINDPRQQKRVAEMKTELARLMQASGLDAKHDLMPLDEGIRKELPDQKIR